MCYDTHQKNTLRHFNDNHNIRACAQQNPQYKTCATSEDSDQPAHLWSLIRVITDLMCLLQPLGYPKRDKREPLPYCLMYRLIWVFAGYTDLIVSFDVCCLICLYGEIKYISMWIFWVFFLSTATNWASALQNLRNGMCTQWRLRSAWAFS